ncbi:MAG: 50S ribosomal protein L13, partial [Gammaproteobacteria bacterium]|nr:50S ribosomal protein L13 [Gammaproteobacteria bacterium]
VIESAVKGMLPKNKLGRAMLKKLKIYAGTEHNHQAQQPQPLSI